MSSLLANPQPMPTGPETFGQKAIRKSKEQPLVPVGAGLTCMALLYAIVRQRQGRSRDMNKWLWARIAFQGLTIGAVVAGSYAMGATPAQQADARKAAEELASRGERAGFEARLRAAEEAHAAESSVGTPVEKTEPAGVGLVRSAGVTSAPLTAEPAGARLVRSAEPTSTPAGSEPAGVQVMRESSGKKSWWGWGK